MRIQHNIMAMSAYRNYTNNVSAMKKNLEKLSSGYKINRAGDDAAGLAISEKMRAQITGLETAQKNAKDGISLVQTAEGALTEVHDMLNRMVQLATQSANGTYDDGVDRKQMQKEVDQLLSEINRIADSSNFNGIKLLDGSLGLNKDAFEIGTAASVDATEVSGMITTEMPAAGATKNTNTILHEAGVEGQLGTFTIDLSQLSATVADATKTAKVNVTIAGIGTPITVQGANAGDALTGIDIAKAVAGKADGTTGYLVISGGTAKIDTAANLTKGDLVYKATANGDGTVTFKAHGYAAADGAVTAITDANIDKLAEVADANLMGTKHIGSAVTVAVNGTDTTLTGAENITTTAPLDTVKPSVTTFGNTHFTFDTSKVTEGMTITIAGETHTFSDDDIKISDLDLTDADDQKDLTERVAMAFKNNQHVSVGTDSTAGHLSLAEKTDGKGVAAKSLASEEMQEKMSTLAGFKSLVSFGTSPKNAGTTIKLKDAGALKDGNVLTVSTATGDKKYEYNKDFTDMASLEAKLKQDGFTTELNGDTITIRAASATDAAPAVLGKGLTLQIGDTADSFNQLNVLVKDMHAGSLGIKDLKINTQELAQAATDKIKAAINMVSDVRGTLGATQNRLEHTINNLSVMTENIQDAESTIRDTDVAEEMMAYTKNNILIQSAQAMLAQANQVPQGVLQLLQ